MLQTIDKRDGNRLDFHPFCLLASLTPEMRGNMPFISVPDGAFRGLALSLLVVSLLRGLRAALIPRSRRPALQSTECLRTHSHHSDKQFNLWLQVQLTRLTRCSRRLKTPIWNPRSLWKFKDTIERVLPNPKRSMVYDGQP